MTLLRIHRKVKALVQKGVESLHLICIKNSNSFLPYSNHISDIYFNSFMKMRDITFKIEIFLKTGEPLH